MPCERDIRAMNTLVRTLEKVLELERKDRSQRSRERKQFRQFTDAEREALADKLDGLRRQLCDTKPAQRTDPSRDPGTEP